VIALHRSDPTQGRYGTVPASFVTLADLTARGPFAPIFIPADFKREDVNDDAHRPNDSTDA
jgi:hypothetical protein